MQIKVIWYIKDHSTAHATVLGRRVAFCGMVDFDDDGWEPTTMRHMLKCERCKREDKRCRKRR